MDDSHAAPSPHTGASPARTALRADLPTWGAELLQILRARRGVLLSTAVGLSLLGLVVTLIAPGTLPPEPLVGGAVGLAAWLLGTAVAVAVDAGDTHVRGPRHIRATGAVLAGWVAPPGGPQAMGSFVRDLNRAYAALGGQRIWLVPTTDTSIDVVDTAGALATGLCQVGRRVLVIDLVSPPSGAGVSEVVRGTHSLGEVVRFDPELLLARVSVGSEPEVALQQVGAIIDRAPGDVDVLLVVLPAVDRPGVLGAVAGSTETFLLARAGTTGRVELLAGLEALESVGTEVSVVLLDQDAPAVPLSPTRAEPPPVQSDDDADQAEYAATPTAAAAAPTQAPVADVAMPTRSEDPDQGVAPDPHAAFRRPDPGEATYEADDPRTEVLEVDDATIVVDPEPAPEPRPAPAATMRAAGADALIEVDAAPASGDRFRTAVALETLAQDHWTPEGRQD